MNALMPAGVVVIARTREDIRSTREVYVANGWQPLNSRPVRDRY
jgi:hypothetical protein